MKILLANNKPEGTTKEDFEKSWNNIGYTLSALYKTIEQLYEKTSTIKEDDFSVPNHYALLAFEAGKKAAYKEIMDFLPKSAKTL